MTNRLPSIILFVFILSACNILEKSAKQELTDGFYTQITDSQKEKVYIDIVEDSILVYPTKTNNSKIEIDTLSALEYHSSQFQSKEDLSYTLSQSSFDVDFIIVPAKFRLPSNNVPSQLNSEINGSVFLGYRTDRYHIKKTLNSLNFQEEKITHLGYSAGFFTGIGNTFMSPTTTNDRLLQEYDGIVWSKGIAVIIGLNNFSVGAAVGFDNLLDSNRTIWIYENKPWIGVALGLNLN